MREKVDCDQTRTEERDQKVQQLDNDQEETLQIERKLVRKSNTVISIDSLSILSY